MARLPYWNLSIALAIPFLAWSWSGWCGYAGRGWTRRARARGHDRRRLTAARVQSMSGAHAVMSRRAKDARPHGRAAPLPGRWPRVATGMGHLSPWPTAPTCVLVTGAASGLGAALTRAFRARGDEVLATDRRATARSRSTCALDVTSDADWAAALAEVERRWGGLDVLVNNAGIAGGGRLDLHHHRGVAADHRDQPPRGGPRACAPSSRCSSGSAPGRIVNIASLAGLVHPGGHGVLQRRQGGRGRADRDRRPRARGRTASERRRSARRTSGPT